MSKRRKGKKKKKGEIVVNDSWAIPKLHIARHAPEHICEKGTLDNYNTEMMENLHQSHCKDPYDLTNHRPGWQKQILRTIAEGATTDEQEDTDDRGGGRGCKDEGEDEDEDEGKGEEANSEWEDNRRQGQRQDMEMRDQSDRHVAGLGNGTSSLGAPETPETPEMPQGRPIISTTNRVAGRTGFKVPTMDPIVPTQSLLAALPHRTRPPPALLTSVQTYMIATIATYASVTIEEVRQDVDIPKLLDDIVRHPYFANLNIHITCLTELRIWDSFRLRIPTSQFAPEPRLTRIHVISSLTKRRTTTPNVIPTRRSDTVFYLPHDEPGFDHSEARLHGMCHLFLLNSHLTGFGRLSRRAPCFDLFNGPNNGST
ncbi:hypothetical protein RSAG8_03559, partial [Rhizoctonia solani AG-8 WAC10335]